MINQPSPAANAALPFRRARIGHINLKVSNIDRSLAFYVGVLGLHVTKRLGDAAAFLAFDDYHHDICINTWESLGGCAPPTGTTGLYHAAIVYEEREGLVQAYRRLRDSNISIDQAVDHGISESLYLRDPDNNGIELYWDRPVAAWWSEQGGLAMGFKEVDAQQMLNFGDAA